MEERVAGSAAHARTGVGPISPRVALVIGAAVVVGVLLYMGRSALGPFVVGLILAYLLDIPVGRLARAGLPRWLAVLVVYVIAVVVLVQGLRLMLRPLADEIAAFIAEFPRFTAQISDQYAHFDLPPALRQAIDGALADLGTSVGSVDPSALLPVLSAFAGVLGTIVAYIIVPVWAFYLIKDRPALAAAAERSLPAAWRADVRAAAGLVLRVFGQWLRGQVFLGITVGIATFVGLMLLSVTIDPIFGRFALLLSVIAGLFELLPIIGPILSAIPAVLLALTAGVEPAVAALVLYLVVQQVENNVLVPKIQGDAVDLHPTLIMVALVVGGAIAGLLGAILALPITAAGRDVFRYVFHRVDEEPKSPDEALAIIRARPRLVDRTTDEKRTADGDAPDAGGAPDAPERAAAEPAEPAEADDRGAR